MNAKNNKKIYEELWSKTRDLIRWITNDYDENYMKIKFNSDDKLFQNTAIKISIMTC